MTESENTEAGEAAANQSRASGARTNPRTALNSIKIKEQIKHSGSGILDDYRIKQMYFAVILYLPLLGYPPTNKINLSSRQLSLRVYTEIEIKVSTYDLCRHSNINFNKTALKFSHSFLFVALKRTGCC